MDYFPFAKHRDKDKKLNDESKSMPQAVMLKKLKLNGSMKTYKTF